MNRLELSVELPWAILYETVVEFAVFLSPICSVTVKLKQNAGRREESPGGRELEENAKVKRLGRWRTEIRVERKERCG
ncbi:hypothetical protein TNCV_879971 [Trichonephila clavipes]|nr:hypothetical protein TNCV_879971 [Trichonephila clavipes]